MTAWAPYTGSGDATDTLNTCRDIIRDHINTQPRSLQTRIGPSEIGNPCDHCLAARLAGWEKNEDAPWLPFIGTCVHARFEDLFIRREIDKLHDGGRRFLTEQKVTVGRIGDTEITGSTDLIDLVNGVTVDWKIVGPTTLTDVRRHGPSHTYRVQQQLYAKGWNDAGITVREVAIYYLPRNAMSMDSGVTWHEPYQPDIAARALERANRLWANLQALTTISTQARDQWISGLPRADGCRDCTKYDDRPAVADVSSLDRLIG